MSRRVSGTLERVLTNAPSRRSQTFDPHPSPEYSRSTRQTAARKNASHLRLPRARPSPRTPRYGAVTYAPRARAPAQPIPKSVASSLPSSSGVIRHDESQAPRVVRRSTARSVAFLACRGRRAQHAHGLDISRALPPPAELFSPPRSRVPALSKTFPSAALGPSTRLRSSLPFPGRAHAVTGRGQPRQHRVRRPAASVTAEGCSRLPRSPRGGGLIRSIRFHRQERRCHSRSD